MHRLLGPMLMSLAVTLSCANAQDFPSRAISIVVPYPAGGVTDSMARLIAQNMQDALGQSVVIENVSGGTGSIGVGKVAHAAPDGYTVILGNVETNVTNAIAVPQNFDVFADFDPVALLPSYAFLLVSKNDIPAKTLTEFIAWLKAHQDTAFQATVGGVGAAQHLCGLRLQQQLGLHWSFVPYRGGASAMQDMMGGQFDMMCTATGSFLPLVQAGSIRAYAVTAKTRLAAAPEIPTVDEAGLPGFHVGVWNAVWAPKGSPKAVIAKLNAALIGAMHDPAIRQKIIAMGLDMPPEDQLTPEALGVFQRAEADIWWPITRRAMEPGPGK